TEAGGGLDHAGCADVQRAGAAVHLDVAAAAACAFSKDGPVQRIARSEADAGGVGGEMHRAERRRSRDLNVRVSDAGVEVAVHLNVVQRPAAGGERERLTV